MRVRMYRTDSTDCRLCCAIREWFAYSSSQTEICWFFAWTKRDPEERTRQNEILQESGLTFFECFAVCYYHISMKLPLITKFYWTWKACCFQWYHTFSTIFIHTDIAVHTAFWNWHLCLFVFHHLWKVQLAAMVWYLWV